MKNGVVAKATFPLAVKRYNSFTHALAGLDSASRRCDSDDTPETRAPSLPRHSAQLREEKVVSLLIRDILPRIAARKWPGLATQGVHLQPGVVGKGYKAAPPGVFGSLIDSIMLNALAALFDLIHDSLPGEACKLEGQPVKQ